METVHTSLFRVALSEEGERINKGENLGISRVLLV